MLFHQAIVAFGGGSGIPALEEVKQSEVDGGDENNGVPRALSRDDTKPSVSLSWLSSYIDAALVSDVSAVHSMMKMNCGWYGDDGVFGADSTSTPLTDTRSSMPPTELWEPIPPTPDCPICLVPMPFDNSKVDYLWCCGNTICSACNKEYFRSISIINSTRKATLPPLPRACLFCRDSQQTMSQADFIERYKSRVRRGDGRAAWNLAAYYQRGYYGLARDESRALQMYHTAANLGSVEVLSNLGFYYTNKYNAAGEKENGMMYLKIGASKGYVYAHIELADIESSNGNSALAMKHLRLAASAGHVPSMKRLWTSFQKKDLSKVDLEETLRAHKAACDQMSSIARTRLLAYEAAMEGNDELLKEHYESYYEGKISAKVLEKVVKPHKSLRITK